MSEPTTAAGRALLDGLMRLDASRPDISAAAPIDWAPVIAAIEAEAVAAYRADLAARVRALEVRKFVKGESDWQQGFRQSRNETVAAVLAEIEEEPR